MLVYSKHFDVLDRLYPASSQTKQLLVCDPMNNWSVGHNPLKLFEPFLNLLSYQLPIEYRGALQDVHTPYFIDIVAEYLSQ